MTAQEFHLDIMPYNASEMPSRLLAEASRLSRQQVKQAMHKGAVWLTHAKHTRRLRRDKAPLKPGDQLHLYYNPEVLQQEPLTPQLIADEIRYSVWFKPAGMLSQGSKWSDHTTITRWAELHLQPQRNAFLVHRLDRAASGLILVAHGKAVTRQLTRLFELRQVEKHYRVRVHGRFPADSEAQRIDLPLDGKPAVSHAQRLTYDPALDQSLLDVRIETGRKHQIRRHLAALSFPVVGDRLHGNSGDTGDLKLCAHSLKFIPPGEDKPVSYMLADEASPS